MVVLLALKLNLLNSNTAINDDAISGIGSGIGRSERKGSDMSCLTANNMMDAATAGIPTDSFAREG
jgi:hypothetical protein